MEDISYMIKFYENEIKPQIEKGSYDEAKTNLIGLLAVLQTEQFTRELVGNLIEHLPSAIASTGSLIKYIERNEIDLIKRCNKYLEADLKQFKMRLEALTKSQS